MTVWAYGMDKDVYYIPSMSPLTQHFAASSSSVPWYSPCHPQTRQLNLWGFKRELRGPKNMEGERYHHPHFNRGKLDELQLIQRAAIKRYPHNRKKQLSSYDSGSVHGLSLSLSRQIAAMTANNQNDDFKIQVQGSNPQPQQKGDTYIAQGAWVLTGLKGQANSLPVGVSAPGSPLPLPLLTAANCFNDMQVQGRMSKNMNVISSYKTSSLPPTTTILSQMQLQSQMEMTNPQPQTQIVSPQMLVQQQMQMMGQSQMFQGYPTPTESNWNPSQLNQGMINEQPTSYGMGMATSMSGTSTNSNIYCMM